MSTDTSPTSDDGFVYGPAGADSDPRALPPEEAWDHFEGLLWAYAFAAIRQELDEALGEIEEEITDGRRPTPEQVAAAKRILNEAEALVEDYYAPLATDAPDDREVSEA